MLGLGPGIDYAAVGESMAMAAVMKDARRAQAHAEGLYLDAKQLIQRQKAHIEELNATVAAMQKLIDTSSENMIKAVVLSIEQDMEAKKKARAETERMWAVLDQRDATAKAHAEENYKAIDGLRADVALLCATYKAMGQAAVALSEALKTAAPGHLLVSSDGRKDKNGEPLDGVDAVFDDTFKTYAAKVGVTVDVADAVDLCERIAARAVAEEKELAPKPKQRVFLEHKPIF